MGSPRFIEDLKGSIVEYHHMSSPSIYKEQLGQFSFIKYKEKVEKLISNAKLAVDAGDKLSNEDLQLIRNNVKELTDTFKEISQLSDSSIVENYKAYTNKIENIFEKQLEWIYKVKFALIEDKIENIPKFLEIVDELNEQEAKSKATADDIIKIKEDLQKELIDFEEKNKKRFAQKEIAKQEEIFNDEANKYRISANWWIVAVILSFIVNLWIIYYLLRNFCFEMNCLRLDDIASYNVIDGGAKTLFLFEIIKSSFFRLLILTLTIYILTFSIKNYNSSMHNKTINRHKANSLAAALNLLTRAKTDVGNDNIMNQAAQSIFSHQITGYIGKENEPSNPIITEKIVEKFINRNS